MKKKLFFLFIILLNININLLPKKYGFTKPVLLEPQCDPFNTPVCITYPKEGQVFVTDTCASGCALCICNNGFQCTQRVLNSLTVRGTTSKPFQNVVVVLINTKLSSGENDLTLEAVTTSQPAPGGTGVWSVTFSTIPTPRPPPFKKDGIPTNISVSVVSKLGWVTNFTTRAIFIKKDKDCNLDCDIVCRRNQTIMRFCKLHTYDNLTKLIKNKYN